MVKLWHTSDPATAIYKKKNKIDVFGELLDHQTSTCKGAEMY